MTKRAHATGGRFNRPSYCRGIRHRLRLESLEKRRLLAVLTVDTDLNVVDAADGMTSLREAIVTANDLAGADEIIFDFGHDGPTTIQLEKGELQLTDRHTPTLRGYGARVTRFLGLKSQEKRNNIPVAAPACACEHAAAVSTCRRSATQPWLSTLSWD